MNQVDFIVFIWSYLVFKTDFKGEENVQPKEVTKKKSLLWYNEILFTPSEGIEDLCTCVNIEDFDNF